MERIEDVMRYPETAAFSNQHDISKLHGAITLRDLTFGYSSLAEPVLRGVNLDLRPGKSVAFVGASGCGKSTVARLIAGLYTPWSGEILFDGRPIADIPREVFTGSVGMVAQDPTIFEDTVTENISMWDKSIKDFEVILAARDAQIHEDILVRPGGYNALLAEGGKDLSGGQKQRLEIARALAADPLVLILDEATSALDAATEAAVMSAIRKRDITLVIIAHRLSTIRDCDEIIVLDKGAVAERGTHAELVALGGLYKKLISTS
jgi:ABC-type bacteriocin/lantibiotic exporter with double-glycine peptidase domain